MYRWQRTLYFHFISFSCSILTLSFELILHRCAISSLGFRSILSPLNVCINFVPSIIFFCPFCVQTVIVLALNSMFTSLYISTSSDFAINLFTLHSTRRVRNTFAWQTDSTIVINLLYSFHFIWRRAMNVAKSHKNRCEKTQTHTRSHWQFCVSKNPILNKLHF